LVGLGPPRSIVVDVLSEMRKNPGGGPFKWGEKRGKNRRSTSGFNCVFEKGGKDYDPPTGVQNTGPAGERR